MKINNSVARTNTSASRPLCSVQTISDDHISKTYVDSSLQRCRRYWEVSNGLAMLRSDSDMCSYINLSMKDAVSQSWRSSLHESAK